MNGPIKTVTVATAGALLGLAMALVAGILAVHKELLPAGGRVNLLATETIAAGVPVRPVLPVALLALLCAACALCLVWVTLRRSRATATALTGGFTVAVALAGGWGLATGPAVGIEYALFAPISLGAEFGLRTWVNAASLEPGVWAAAIIACGALWFTRARPSTSTLSTVENQ